MAARGGSTKVKSNGKRAVALAVKPGAKKPARTNGTASPAGPRSFCSMPVVPERVFPPNVVGNRLGFLQVFDRKWINGTVLYYYFFDKNTDGEEVAYTNGQKQWVTWVGSEAQKNVVRNAFATWKALGIGLEFKEVTAREDAQVRIGFMQGDGSWSYIGRDVYDEGQRLGVNARTMNFGWDLRQADGLDTALHEIGHTLGAPHEHQNPNAGIVWDEAAVYAALAAPPNRWDHDTTFYNIIRKLPANEVRGSSWDPNSVMHYPFEAGLIKSPEPYRMGLHPAGGLSSEDVAWIRKFYPPLGNAAPAPLTPAKSAVLHLEPGQQKDFEIIPAETKFYHIGTFGESDTLMVLFEDEDGRLRYRSADDDSGLESNAKMRVKLVRNRRYVLRVRLHYKKVGGDTSVMIW